MPKKTTPVADTQETEKHMLERELKDMKRDRDEMQRSRDANFDRANKLQDENNLLKDEAIASKSKTDELNKALIEKGNLLILERERKLSLILAMQVMNGQHAPVDLNASLSQ